MNRNLLNFLADAGEWFLSYVEKNKGFERKLLKDWGKFNG